MIMSDELKDIKRELAEGWLDRDVLLDKIIAYGEQRYGAGRKSVIGVELGKYFKNLGAEEEREKIKQTLLEILDNRKQKQMNNLKLGDKDELYTTFHYAVCPECGYETRTDIPDTIKEGCARIDISGLVKCRKCNLRYCIGLYIEEGDSDGSN